MTRDSTVPLELCNGDVQDILVPYHIALSELHFG